MNGSENGLAEEDQIANRPAHAKEKYGSGGIAEVLRILVRRRILHFPHLSKWP
jgi:hypothetical protein